MRKKLWKRKATVRDNLRIGLPAMSNEYFEEGRKALGTESAWEQMHQFRLLTKRFRYTLEIFRPAYGPGLEARIESLRSIQTLLGDINDCIVTSAMLAGLPDQELMREKLAENAERRTSKLRKFWQTRFDAPGERERWARYLTLYVCRPRPSRRPVASREALVSAAAGPEPAT